MGPQVHAKFQRNRLIRYRDTAGGTFVTSPPGSTRHVPQLALT